MRGATHCVCQLIIYVWTGKKLKANGSALSPNVAYSTLTVTLTHHSHCLLRKLQDITIVGRKFKLSSSYRRETTDDTQIFAEMAGNSHLFVRRYSCENPSLNQNSNDITQASLFSLVDFSESEISHDNDVLSSLEKCVKALLVSLRQSIAAIK